MDIHQITPSLSNIRPVGSLYISLIDHCILQGCIYTLMPKELLNLFDGHAFIYYCITIPRTWKQAAF